MERIKSYLLLVSLIFCTCGKENTDSFRASGIVEGTSVKVSAQTPGLILSMMVEEGDRVLHGQPLAIIDTVKLALQLEQIDAGLEEIEIERQIHLNTQATARSDYENVAQKYRRVQQLFGQNSATQQQLDDANVAHTAAETQLQNISQRINAIKSKEKGLIAQRKLVRKQLDDATVIAPLAGTITAKFYEAGETVPPARPLVELIDLSRMWTKVYLSEPLLARVRLGAKVDIKVDGYEEVLSGHVSWISPKAEFTPKNILTDENRTSLVYAVKVTAANDGGILKHGMPVAIVLPL